MTLSDDHQRMLERDKKPTREDIFEYLGKNVYASWEELMRFMEQNYDIEPETVFYGKNYGWLVRYRKSNKTLCSFFPEKNSFTFLITYGKKEIEKFQEVRTDFSSYILDIFDTTEKLHDGKWLFIRLTTSNFNNEVKRLILIKRKQKNK